MSMNIGVVIIARNEEKYLEPTLNALKKQSLKPTKVVVVNDCSTDKTKNIAEKFQVEVIDFPYEHDSWVVTKNLAKVFNLGFQKLGLCDYVMILGADHILSKNYIETIINRIHKTDIVVASGIIKGENAVNVRGSGRIINGKFWEKLGSKYQEKEGYESYILFKAESLGFQVKKFSDIITTTQRKTSTNYNLKKLVYKGESYRALGYTLPYTIAAAVKFIKIHPLAPFFMMYGYIKNNSIFYEQEIRQLVKNYQKNRIKSFLHV